ncbi:MAG: gliding motility protein GldN [Bacteroidetes bacterium]|nr:gliding motility protein GldN [Bacteroidota bacterium]
MIKLKTIIAATAISINVQAIAQDEPQQLPWQQRDRAQAQPIPFEYVREADVMWSKMIWRVIDVNQKMNLPLAYPQKPLAQLIHEAAKKGEVTVYDPAVEYADQFRSIMDTDKVKDIGERIDTVIQVDPLSLTEVEVEVAQHLDYGKIVKYKVKEVWYFDTKNSTMQVRIIALAPVMEYRDAAGNYIGDMVMYWVPYENLRTLFAKNEVPNPQNDSQHYSWDDLFVMRKFGSTIYKESNVYDRNIQEYATGVDALLEADRIKQELFEKEHDLWNY